MSQQFRILMVEDVETDAELMLRELERAGIRCDAHRVETAVEYRRELEDFQPQVILSAFSMPSFNGMEALRIARQSYPHIPFVFVSGILGEENAVRALKNGAADFVLKNNLRRLPAAVERAINEAEARRARQVLEHRLRESDKRYRELFQSNPHPMWMYDIETLRFLAVNDTAVTRYGFSREEFLAMTIKDIRPEKDFPRFLDHIAKPLPMVNKLESWHHRTKSGELIDVEIASHDLVMEGRPARIVVAYDITERKRAEEGLLRFRMAMETALDGIFLMDFETFRYLDVNETGCRMLGYSREELLTMRTMDTNLDISEADQRRRFEAARALGSDHIMTEPAGRFMRRKDRSTFPIEVARRYLRIGEQEIVVGIARDITERKESEIKIGRLNRVYAVLSGINAAIVRIRDRRELFQEACRIIVEHGHFTLGWVAVLDHATGKLTAVAQAGLPENLGAGSAFLNGLVGLMPAGTAEVALREKRSAIDNVIEDAPGSLDAEHEPDTLAVRRAAIELGAKSVIVLPLVVEEETFGILTLYAPERNFFDDEEMKLLNELAGDLSFGLEFIAKEEKVDYLAYYDPLTGLPNRSLFSERLSQQLHTRADSPELVAVVLMDVERLRLVNDTLGRQAGDEVLRLIARRLESNATMTHWSNPARVVGDSFGVIIRGARDVNELAHLLEEGMKACFGVPFVIDGKEFRLVARAGVSAYPTDGSSAESLLQNAEAALRNAKRTTERFVFYAPEMNAKVAEILALETRLRKAIELEQFVLHYQPKIDAATGKTTGVEALIRWNDPDTGMVPPLQFIHILEETGMIFEVGRWALGQALADQRRWRGKGLPIPRVAVNVSARQLRDQHFVRDVQLALASQEGLNPALELEITESLLMEDIERNIERLKTLRDLGVTIAIDDFGTGYSSLNYLARLPMDTLKIDRSFVVGIAQSTESRTIVSTVISLAHSLGLKVVAEGVETEEQLKLLRLLKCDEVQGFLLSRPVASDDLARFLSR